MGKVPVLSVSAQHRSRPEVLEWHFRRLTIISLRAIASAPLDRFDRHDHWQHLGVSPTATAIAKQEKLPTSLCLLSPFDQEDRRNHNGNKTIISQVESVDTFIEAGQLTLPTILAASDPK